MHEVEVEYREEDIFVLADEDRLVQAVVNLLSNAIKVPTRRRLYKIKTQLIDEKNADQNVPFCEVQIIDQGRGIGEEKAKTLFQRTVRRRKAITSVV